MDDKKGHNINVDIGIGAKAEIKAEIPPESSGRLLDALTDIIRPFSERRGLAADKLRLQRAEVAIEIAELASQKLRLEGKEAKPLPTKIVVPLLERGSLEDPTDEVMISKWAELLASGAKGAEIQPRYVSILGELSSSQVKTFSAIARNKADEWKHPHQQFADAWLRYGMGQIDTTIEQAIDLCKTNSENFLSEIFGYISGPGRFVTYMSVDGDEKWDGSYIDDFTGKESSIKTDRDIEILSSLSLLSIIERDIKIKRTKMILSLKMAYITWIGVEFIELCDPVIRKDLRAYEPS